MDSESKALGSEAQTPVVHQSTSVSGEQLAMPRRQDTQASSRFRSRRSTGDGSRPDSRGQPFSLRRAATTMLTPVKEVGPAPGVFKSIRAILTNSWLNLLLVFIPVSWALHFSHQSDTVIFVFAFLAIIPLAKLLAFATDELSMRVGQTLAGLLNATLGNAVELIVAIIALTQCQLRVVQSSLVGSILSNLLLVLGMCFFAGGTRFSEQGFGMSATQLNSSLLTISVIAVLLPAAFHLSSSETGISTTLEGSDILKVSHGVAIILLFIYGSYLVFQLFSHKALYDDSSNDVSKSTQYAPRRTFKQVLDDRAEKKAKKNGTWEPREPIAETHADVEAHTAEADEEDKPEMPKMSVAMTIGLLAVVTVLVAVTAEWLVDSIDGLTDGGAISKEFVGIILLPIVGNAAEHVTAVTVSVKDKLTLSLGVAVGSSIQIALFVIPFIVTLGWILGKPLTLLFDSLESIVLFLTVLTVNYVVQDGKSNWLEGMILMCLYLILAVTFWFYPGSDPSGLLNKCT